MADELPTESADTDAADPKSKRHSVLRLPNWQRRLGALLAAGVAATHLIWPTAPIDGVFLGLLVFAAVLLFFDVETLEWQGMKLRQRSKDASAQLAAAPVAEREPAPLAPPPVVERKKLPYTAHKPANDLLPPTDPVERITWAAEQIRVELVILAGNAGYLPPDQPWSAYSAVPIARDLGRRSVLPESLLDPITVCIDNRNAVLHRALGIAVLGREAVTLALDTLLALREVKRNYHRVAAFPVRLYADQSMTTLLDPAGLLIQQLNDDGKLLGIAVYPTGRSFLPGHFVTWNWDMDRVVRQEAWYEHPQTGRATIAFSQAAFFYGMEYPEQWGVEYRLPALPPNP